MTETKTERGKMYKSQVYISIFSNLLLQDLQFACKLYFNISIWYCSLNNQIYINYKDDSAEITIKISSSFPLLEDMYHRYVRLSYYLEEVIEVINNIFYSKTDFFSRTIFPLHPFFGHVFWLYTNVLKLLLDILLLWCITCTINVCDLQKFSQHPL